MTAEHVCAVKAGAGGLINEAWCFQEMAEVLSLLPRITTPVDMLRPELLLFEDGPVIVRYCPFDSVNLGAKIVIVGITPGLHQMFLSCREAQRALAEGHIGDEVLPQA